MPNPQKSPTLSRRTLIKGVAWAAPTIAVAVSAPTVAASTVTGAVDNADAMYYWDEAAAAPPVSLTYDNLDAPTNGNFSVQTNVRGSAWGLSPWPTGAVMTGTIIFDQPVVLTGPGIAGLEGSGTTWTYTLPLERVGQIFNVSFNFVPAAGAAYPGEVSVFMHVDNPQGITWPIQGVKTTPDVPPIGLDKWEFTTP